MSLMSAPDRLSQRNRAGSTSGAVSGMGKAPGWQHRACGGSSQQLQGWGKMVGAAGFEPTTLCPPDKCATRLRYAPTARRHRQTGLLRQALFSREKEQTVNTSWKSTVGPTLARWL